MRKILLIGGTGFVGRQVALELSRQHDKVYIPTRQVEAPANLKLNPAIHIISASDYSVESLSQWMRLLGPDGVVINLAGILHDKNKLPYGLNFKRTHVELPKAIIQAMKATGLKRLIHMSALGASPTGHSMYSRSKGDGEALVKNSGLQWTIFRPSVIFGEEDSFINLFGKLQKYFPVFPLAGAHVKFQAVCVKDVALAFVRSINLPTTYQKVFDLGGPKIYSLADIVRIAGLRVGHMRKVIPLANWMGYLQAWALEYAPGATLMSRDNLASMREDNILRTSDNCLETVFEIRPIPLESMLQ